MSNFRCCPDAKLLFSCRGWIQELGRLAVLWLMTEVTRARKCMGFAVESAHRHVLSVSELIGSLGAVSRLVMIVVSYPQRVCVVVMETVRRVWKLV